MYLCKLFQTVVTVFPIVFNIINIVNDFVINYLFTCNIFLYKKNLALIF